jgi:hypothetical protein
MTQKWIVYEQSDQEHESYNIKISPGRSSYYNQNLGDEEGFPKELAQWICDTLNNSAEKCPFVNDGFEWQKLETLEQTTKGMKE